LLRPFPLAERLGPAGFLCQRAAGDGKRVGRDVLGDHRTGRGDGTFADFDRGHQCGIGADEGARANFRDRLGEAVIVAGNRACPDVGA